MDQLTYQTVVNYVILVNSLLFQTVISVCLENGIRGISYFLTILTVKVSNHTVFVIILIAPLYRSILTVKV